jgi:signal transduction histidine kinase
VASLLVRLVLAVACGLPIAKSSTARADDGFDVAHTLDGVPLGRFVELLEDTGGSLRLADIVAPDQAMRFRESQADAPSFGLTDSVYWVRLTIHSTSGTQRSWLLELAYPQLDDVTLYAPGADGNYAERATGDIRPFSSRDLAYRTFVFSLHEPPTSTRVYYLRVKTTGAMNLPLVGWDAESFIAHQPYDLGAAFFFYGIMLVMACYNLAAYAFIRQVEHLHYVMFIVSSGILQFTLSGHMFQFVLPNQMWLVQQLIPLGFAFSLGTACYTGNAYLALQQSFPVVTLWLNRLGTAYLVAGVLTMALPYHLRLLIVGFGFALVSLALAGLSVYLLSRKVSRAKLYTLAWAPLIVGFSVYALCRLGVLPSFFFFEWAIQIGSSVQLVLLSSALADSVNVMRRDLSALNGELSKKVDALEGALTRAEDATARAETATRVKDEFMATMSHELRTPLNAIINVPQGLLRDFPRVEAVACEHCKTTFELERGEKVASDTACPECGQSGSLEPRMLQRYVGKPEHTARYLGMIERSGQHLMQMVNGVLDFSKMEVGRLDLVLEPIEVGALVHEVADEMTLYAERAGVQIESLPGDDQLAITADPVRVRQVLINLLSNAIKFSDGAGVVRVGFESRADACQFFVQDQGIGIAPEHFERIFSSFEQVHKGNTRKYGGTGLGLSISRSLVRMHGGELWVESELGKGATFFFRIPKGLTGGRIRALSSRMKPVTSASRPQHGEELAS